MDAIMQPLRLTLAYANACCGVALNVVGVYAGKGITVTPVTGLFPAGTGPTPVDVPSPSIGTGPAPVDIPITSIGSGGVGGRGGGDGGFTSPRTSVSSVPDEGERLRYHRDGGDGGGDGAGRRSAATVTAPVSAAATAAAAAAAAAAQQHLGGSAGSDMGAKRYGGAGPAARGPAAWSMSPARPKGGGGEPGSGGGSMHTPLYDIPFPATAPAEAKFSRSASMASVTSIGLEGVSSLSNHALSFDLAGAGPDGFFNLGSKTDLAMAATAEQQQQGGGGGGKDGSAV
ncbi:unnamed protein product [Ectocarpus fasciculatus]